MVSAKSWFLFSVLLLVVLGCSQSVSVDHGSVPDVDDSTFETVVLNADQPVLVDFWAPWCGPCRQLSPTVAEVAGDFQGRASVVKLNVDDAPEASQEYGITSIPALLVFQDGKVVDRLVGVQTKAKIASMLESTLDK